MRKIKALRRIRAVLTRIKVCVYLILKPRVFCRNQNFCDIQNDKKQTVGIPIIKRVKTSGVPKNGTPEASFQTVCGEFPQTILSCDNRANCRNNELFAGVVPDNFSVAVSVPVGVEAYGFALVETEADSLIFRPVIEVVPTEIGRHFFNNEFC